MILKPMQWNLKTRHSYAMAAKGDELPQVAGMEDTLIDVYSDMLNVPQYYAASRLHHQYEDEFEGFKTLIH